MKKILFACLILLLFILIFPSNVDAAKQNCTENEICYELDSKQGRITPFDGGCESCATGLSCLPSMTFRTTWLEERTCKVTYSCLKERKVTVEEENNCKAGKIPESELAGKPCATRTAGIQTSSGVLSADCSQAGLQCLPATAAQIGTGCQITYQCLKTAKITPAEVSACDKGWDEYKGASTTQAAQDAAKNACIQAGTGVETGIFTKGLSPQCLGCGDCSQKDVFQEFINIFAFILQISGSLAVLIIIIGGIMYMTAAGDQQKTGKAKAALTAAIVGIIIVLVAYLIINSVLTFLGYKNIGSWFGPSLQ